MFWLKQSNSTHILFKMQHWRAFGVNTKGQKNHRDLKTHRWAFSPIRLFLTVSYASTEVILLLHVPAVLNLYSFLHPWKCARAFNPFPVTYPKGLCTGTDLFQSLSPQRGCTQPCWELPFSFAQQVIKTASLSAGTMHVSQLMDWTCHIREDTEKISFPSRIQPCHVNLLHWLSQRLGTVTHGFWSVFDHLHLLSVSQQM